MDISEHGLIPVLNLSKLSYLSPLMEIFRETGIKSIEITYRNQNASLILKELKTNHGDFFYGAGTVRTMSNLENAIQNGVHFIVTPGLNESIANIIKERGFSNYFPGIDSTLGLEKAINLGYRTVKIFPAEILGGSKYLKALSEPYYDLHFIPSGGIDLNNMVEYLKIPNVVALSGSFLAPNKYIENEDWHKIREICKSAVKIYHTIRG